MSIWIVFLVLTTVEAYIVWMKWSDVNDYADLGKDVSNLTGFDKKKAYSIIVKILSKINIAGRWVLIIIVPLLLLLNLIISLVLGGILELIF